LINPPELPINDEARNDAQAVLHAQACSRISAHLGFLNHKNETGN